MYEYGPIMTGFAPRSATLVIYVVTVLAMTDVMGRARVAHANGPQAHVSVEPPTRLERFVVGACSPCAIETHGHGRERTLGYLEVHPR